MGFQEMITMTTLDFFEHMTQQFCPEPVFPIETVEDMQKASAILSVLIGNYSYLTSLLAYLKIMVRQEKRAKNKEIYEDLIDKKEVVQELVDATKLTYNGISRMITVKIEIDKEIQMSSHL